MSAVILQMPERKPKAKPTEFPQGMNFVCNACDAREFRIYENGSVYCACCKAFINNLWARKT